MFKLIGYADKKDRNEIFSSTSFYTHTGGYRMCVLVVPNGHGDVKGTHMSVFVKLLEGCYDKHLHWPFLGTVTYELLNQLKNVGHHRVISTLTSQHDMKVSSVSSAPIKFLPHSSLERSSGTNTQYLLDDTLYFRVSVSVSEGGKPQAMAGLYPSLIKLITLNKRTEVALFF